MSASISAHPPSPVPLTPPVDVPVPPPPLPILLATVIIAPPVEAVVKPLFTLLVRLNIFDPPPPNEVLLVTFLNTLFVLVDFLTNAIDRPPRVLLCILLYYRKKKYWLDLSRNMKYYHQYVISPVVGL